MTITRNRKIKGVSAALAVSGFQSFESILLVIFAVVAAQLTNEMALAGATMLLKESFSLGLMLVTSTPFLIKNTYKKLKSKQGVQFIIASVIGTSLGNICFLSAVFLAGSGYGAILTSLYPAISITLLNWILKEKESWKVWGGVMFTMFSSAMFVLLPAVIASKQITTKIVVGMILGGFTSFFWAIEGVFVNVGIRGPIEFTNKEVMATRSFFTTVTSAILITPLTCAFGDNSYHYIDVIMGDYKSGLLVFATGLNIFLLRVSSIYAIRMVGAKITSVIDTFNFILPAVFTEFFALIPGELGMHYDHNKIVWWAFILVIPILVGVFISVYYQKPHVKEDNAAIIIEPK